MNTFTKLVLVSLFSAGSMLAATPYLGAGVGYWTESADAVFNARVGVDVARQGNLVHAAEFEVLRGTDNVPAGSVTVTGFMANYRLTIETPQKVYFMAGGGVGSALTEVEVYWFKGRDSAFAYQFFTGAGYKFSGHWSAELSARYLNIGKVNIGWMSADVGDDTSIELGIKYGF